MGSATEDWPKLRGFIRLVGVLGVSYDWLPGISDEPIRMAQMSARAYPKPARNQIPFTFCRLLFASALLHEYWQHMKCPSTL